MELEHRFGIHACSFLGWADAGVGIGIGWVDPFSLVEKTQKCISSFLIHIEPILNILKKIECRYQGFRHAYFPTC